jgi:hypothetical protein
MASSISKRRQKKLRRHRNKAKKEALLCKSYKPLPMRKKIVLMSRRRVVMSFDLQDAIEMPFDDQPVTRGQVLKQTWRESGFSIKGSA